MSADRAKSPEHASLRRALRYLRPHTPTIVISVICALLVGAAFTSGLGTMLPIMQVLIRGESIQGWLNRKIVEQRLDVRLADRSDRVQVQKVHKPGAGLSADDELLLPGMAGATAEERERISNAEKVLEALADPSGGQIALLINGRPGSVQVSTLPWYLAAVQRVADLLPPGDKPIHAIAAVMVILTLLAVVGNVFRFFQEYLSDKVAILTVNSIRQRLYDHVLHVPLGFFGSRGTSDVTSRLAQDTANLQEGIKQLLGPSVQEPIKAVMAIGLAMAVSWKLVLFIGLFAPVMALLMKKFGKKMRRASRSAMQSSASMLGQLEGTLVGIRVVKAFNAERFERKRYGRIMAKLVSESLRMSRIDAMSAPILESITLLVAGAVVLYAAYLVLVAKALEAGDFILVMICLASIGESLRRCGKINNAIQKANAASARIFEAMDLPVERPRHLETAVNRPRIQLAPISREVRFEDVTFAYPGTNSPAVREVSLTVKKGQSVAIVGRNGSGKTTLLALLARFYDPQQGRISIDGIDIQQVTLKSLRQQIGIVTQDSVIFPGTIEQNIAYGVDLPSDARQREALRQRVISAAKRAFADDFIREKPAGYETMLDGLGGQLSGGQKQRLCIARAIFRASPILVLDEATSQVDAESEHLIQQAIENLMHERTTFVIAHRFSTILSADTIVVMERGQIVGQGQHEQLLQTCTTYQQLYERQLMGKRPAEITVVADR